MRTRKLTTSRIAQLSYNLKVQCHVHNKSLPGLSPEPDEYSPHLDILVFGDHLNVIHSSTDNSPSGLFLAGFEDW
jgi:hypothetical protein